MATSRKTHLGWPIAMLLLICFLLKGSSQEESKADMLGQHLRDLERRIEVLEAQNGEENDLKNSGNDQTDE